VTTVAVMMTVPMVPLPARRRSGSAVDRRVGYPRPVLGTLEDRLVVGDESVLRDIFDEYGPLVLGIGRKLIGDDAEDLVQQVFLAAWRGRDRFDPSKGSLAAWLSGITRFKAIDHLRAAGRRPSTPTAEVGELDPVEPQVDRVVDRLVLASALDGLPKARRQVVEMGFFDDLTHVEIAERLDLPLGTVKSHMRRGLESLQRELEGSRVLS
jgi:RNA polymerase sigma-70 factor (ECF subfamily)